MESNYQSEPFTGEAILCENLLNATVEGVYTDLIEEFSKIEELKDAAACIVENLRVFKWSNLEIKERLYEFSDSLSDDEKTAKFREIKTAQGKLSNDAIVSCLAEKEFGELFEQVFKKDDQEDYVGDYCARTFALENKLVDTDRYQVNPNPNKIITNDIDCNIINKKHFVEAEEELKQNLLKDSGENQVKVNCLIEKYREHHYFNKTLAVALLGEINIAGEQKELEKKNFVQVMIKITKTLQDC